jgi:hypothetical protein
MKKWRSQNRKKKSRDQYDVGVSVVRQKNMSMGPAEPETKNDCAGEAQHQSALLTTGWPSESVVSRETAFVVGG